MSVSQHLTYTGPMSAIMGHFSARTGEGRRPACDTLLNGDDDATKSRQHALLLMVLLFFVVVGRVVLIHAGGYALGSRPFCARGHLPPSGNAMCSPSSAAWAVLGRVFRPCSLRRLGPLACGPA